ncbi:MAG: SDR family NAD(P)-dependent oxidoreductase [Janthinobacterium lividum]
MVQLSRSTAVVTGGGSGIGAAVARLLAAAGASVVVADLDEAAAVAVENEIVAAGGVAAAFPADVGRPEDAAALVTFARQRFGDLRLAVNNAGVGSTGTLLGDHTDEDWQRILTVNLTGVFYGLRAQLPAIADAGGGAVVNIASVMGTVATPGSAAYTAAKHGVVGLTKTAALEYAASGVRVNAVGPGYIETPLLDGRGPRDRAALVERTPLGRLGTPEDVAALVVFLLGEGAAFITGSFHLVDGGYCAR